MRLPVSICAMIVSAFFCVLPFSAGADIWSPPAGVGEPLGGYLSALKKQTPGALFFADCAIGDHKKALMIFRAGSAEGRFYMLGYRTGDRIIGLPSHGELSIRAGRIEILKLSGAMQDMMPKVAGALMAGTFKYVPSSMADDMVRHRPLETCSGQPNPWP